ncbi:hypothetical protein [Pseudoalteromonas tetraodonis]
MLLLVADDHYEPKQTVNNTREFIYTNKVDALFAAKVPQPAMQLYLY